MSLLLLAACAPASARPAGVAACADPVLAAHVVRSGSVMSQPFLTIALRNTGTRRCVLDGYAVVRAEGHAGWRQDRPRRLRIRVADRSTYEVRDPGPRPVSLAPGASARFTVGTATAYQGGAHVWTISRLRIGTGSGSYVDLAVELLASAPVGQPIPVDVTAFTAASRR